MTEPTAVVPVLKAHDDEGAGFRVVIESMSHDPILEVLGASLSSSNGTTRITLRSEHQDFEGDYLYLLDAEMVVGLAEWAGGTYFMEGVLTKLLWRTEDMVTEDLVAIPSGDGCYVPKGPMPEDSHATWRGQPTPMMQVRVRVSPRRDHG